MYINYLICKGIHNTVESELNSGFYLAFSNSHIDVTKFYQIKLLISNHVNIFFYDACLKNNKQIIMFFSKNGSKSINIMNNGGFIDSEIASKLGRDFNIVIKI